MKIYLHGSSKGFSKISPYIKDLIKFFKSKKYVFQVNAFYTAVTNNDIDQLKSIDIENERYLFNESDLIIIESSKPSFGLGALFSLGLTSKKHVLCIYHEDAPKISDLILFYQSPLFYKIVYSDKTLSQQLKDLEKKLDKNKLQKFNFIATKELVDYLDEMSNRLGVSKSEYLRDIVDTYRKKKIK